MSREEILEKLPEDLKAMLHYMDCCFDEYTLINQDKTLEVKRCYEEYTLEVLSWHNKNNYSDIISQSWMWIS